MAKRDAAMMVLGMMVFRIALGVAIGSGIGVATGNPAMAGLGIAVGVVLAVMTTTRAVR